MFSEPLEDIFSFDTALLITFLFTKKHEHFDSLTLNIL